MITKLITVSCLVILILELLFVIINVLCKKRAQRIAFLRSFKKGKCAIIYITAIPLYCLGHMHSGQGFLAAFFNAVNKIVSLVVLRYDIETIEGLMLIDPLYHFTIYFCFALVGVNALILTLSLTNQHIWEAIQAVKALTTRKDKLFIFGNNSENISIYKSDKSRNKVIIDDISNEESEKLYMRAISFVSSYSFKAQVSRIFRSTKKLNRECIIIVNTLDDEKNIAICREIIDKINEEPDEIKEHLFKNVKVYAFGNPRYQTIYDDIVKSGSGCIHYVNKYHKIAIDFIDKYPLSKFMDESQIDYKTSLVKDDVDINVLFIGFGKTAQQVFTTSVANNQFLKKGANDPELKAVKYFIFDKEDAENNKNLNHSYYRYRFECKSINPEDYLPLPSLPAEEIYHKLDVNDCNFYNEIRAAVTRNKNDANFIVIAFGSDLENLDMAQKLVEKRKEWGLENLVIFVKVRVWHKEQTLLDDEGCYFIGNERDIVYNIDNIMSNDTFSMAQMRNEIYDLESTVTANPNITVDDALIQKNKEEANKNWHTKKSQMQRESSIYCCLSLRSKLNLMGLDYCKKKNDEDKGITEEEYLKIYAADDMPDFKTYNLKANGKPIVYYNLNFQSSRRRNMTIHEHLRWNSFMISKGTIPSSRDQIENEMIIDDKGNLVHSNGKNYELRRHGNLTTFEGLVEYRKIVAARDKTDEMKKDVIKYDYQLLDDAYWLLESNGYKIVKHVKMK